MSDQLTLADVAPGHYYMIEGQLYWFDSYIDNPAIGNPCSLLRIPSGHSRHVTLKKARQLSVELMELVQKDRDQSLRPWEKAEHIAEPWACYSDFEAWFRGKLAPMEGVDPDNDAAWEKFLEESPVLAHTTLYSVFCDAVDEAIKKAIGE